ncbi:hypothetical protein VPH35_010235 [Triticum aestivum]
MAMAPRALLLLAVGLVIVGSCPKDGLKLKACADVLGLLKLKLNVPRDETCCSLLDGLIGLDAALSLCANIDADVLGLKLHLPVNLRLVLNNCGKVCPTDFRCPPRH